MPETPKNGYVTTRMFFSVLGATCAFLITLALTILNSFSTSLNGDMDIYRELINGRLDRMSKDIDYMQRELYAEPEIANEETQP